MYETIRWGILGTGNIAGQFATGLKVLDDAELLAVGSRNQESADAFGEKFHVPRRYASYESLAADPDIDAVYIGTLHPFHYHNTLLCLNNGKAVLTEKPFAMNADEAAEMINLAREKQRFLMEAMWTRFNPIITRLRELVAADRIGEVRMLTADFGFRFGWKPEHRLLNPDFGGGALLDVGIYPVSLAFMILGPPATVTSQAHIGEAGVDEQNALIFAYADGAMAVLQSAVRTATPQVAVVNGTRGRITVHSRWWNATRMTVEVNDTEPEEIHLPLTGNGYNYEAAEVARCLREGRLESDVMSWDETLEIMRTLDAIRAQWGLTYPMEQ